MTTATNVKTAISRSVSHTEIVAVKLQSADFREAVFAELTAIESLGLAEEYDSATENDGSEDVWGVTPAGDNFRIRLIRA